MTFGHFRQYSRVKLKFCENMGIAMTPKLKFLGGLKSEGLIMGGAWYNCVTTKLQ